MTRVGLIAFALLLTGCVSNPTKVEVVTVEIPVKMPCIDKAPERPAFRYGQGEWVGEKQAAMMLADDFEKAEQWGIQWEAAAAGCLF